jgi:hypothetical protein
VPVCLVFRSGNSTFLPSSSRNRTHVLFDLGIQRIYCWGVLKVDKIHERPAPALLTGSCRLQAIAVRRGPSAQPIFTVYLGARKLDREAHGLAGLCQQCSRARIGNGNGGSVRLYCISSTVKLKRKYLCPQTVGLNSYCTRTADLARSAGDTTSSHQGLGVYVVDLRRLGFGVLFVDEIPAKSSNGLCVFASAGEVGVGIALALSPPLFFASSTSKGFEGEVAVCSLASPSPPFSIGVRAPSVCTCAVSPLLRSLVTSAMSPVMILHTLLPGSSTGLLDACEACETCET